MTGGLSIDHKTLCDIRDCCRPATHQATNGRQDAGRRVWFYCDEHAATNWPEWFPKVRRISETGGPTP